MSKGESSNALSTIPMNSAFVPKVMVAKVVEEINTPPKSMMKSSLLLEMRLRAYPIILNTDFRCSGAN